MDELLLEVASLKRKLGDMTEMYRTSQAIVQKYEGLCSRPVSLPPPPPREEVVECSLFIAAGGEEEEEEGDEKEDEEEEEQAVENSQDSFLRYVNPVVEVAQEEEEEEWVSQDLLGLPPTQVSLQLPATALPPPTLPSLSLPSLPLPLPLPPPPPIALLSTPPPPPAPRQAKYASVVRGKARQALPGHACEECVKFFESIKTTLHPGEDMQTVMNRYSRHRHEHKPPPTPPGYWSVWSLEDNEEEDNPKRVKL